MKGVVDLFVAKDRTAILWFLIACVSIGLSAMYVTTMTKEVRTKPQFVIMDSAGVYYAAPSLEFENATDIHTAQTQLAMETIYNRNPTGLDSENRRPRLFVDLANDYIDQELGKESSIFRNAEFHQKVEVNDIQVLKATGVGEALTYAKGQLIRIGKFKGKPVNEIWDVEARFLWKLNKGFGRANAFFPTVCVQMSAQVHKSSS